MESAEVFTIGAATTRRSEAIVPICQRLNVRRNDTYDIGFGPNLIDELQKFSPRSARVCLHENHLLKSSTHDLVQALTHIRGRYGWIAV